MANFAVIKEDVVENIINADSLIILQVLIPEEVLVEVTDSTGLAFIGATYSSSKKKFVPIQPYSSWTWDAKSWSWKAPVAYPTDGDNYWWNEEEGAWKEIVFSPMEEDAD
jgi:hypothetical protein